jgi:hypothetical protein
MSEVKVNKISPRSGTDVALGDSGDTFTVPSGATLDIASGATLTNSGTASGFASIAWQSSIVTAATLTAVAGEGYWINTTSNACTVTLPASASVGDQLIFTDYARTWGTNAVTINPNSLNFQGNSSPDPVYDTSGESVDIVYSGATKGWIPNNDGAVVLETPQTYSVDFLVIAGGGSSSSGGNGEGSGGGGAGGYRTSTQTVTGGTSITVTVGDGGAGTTFGDLVTGNNGSNSSISGSGLTTITSAGGGGGGKGYPSSINQGLAGGSGGGNGCYNTGTGGAGNTPSTSPSQGNNGGAGDSAGPYYLGGGGGGAGAVGGNSSGSNAGSGGNGIASSITGSSVTRAGGGGAGGGSYSSATAGTGGTGGGGNGGQNSAGTAGTANTGGGGGGSSSTGNGANGGKGVVILSMPDADYSSATTGSPTVATGVSGKTVLTFTGTGSYTT